MTASDAEIELRELILSDPEKGWGDFWQRYERFVKNLVQKYHLSIEDEEEVFQEVSLRLAKDQSRMLRVWDPERCNLKGFLAVMVTSACLNFLKSSFHRFNQLTVNIDTIDHSWEDPAPSPAERLERVEVVRSLRKFLGSAVEKGLIRHEDAMLFELRLGGLSLSEISRLWGVPAETLGTRFHRLKTKLKKHLPVTNPDLT